MKLNELYIFWICWIWLLLIDSNCLASSEIFSISKNPSGDCFVVIRGPFDCGPSNDCQSVNFGSESRLYLANDAGEFENIENPLAQPGGARSFIKFDISEVLPNNVFIIDAKLQLFLERMNFVESNLDKFPIGILFTISSSNWRENLVTYRQNTPLRLSSTSGLYKVDISDVQTNITLDVSRFIHVWKEEYATSVEISFFFTPFEEDNNFTMIFSSKESEISNQQPLLSIQAVRNGTQVFPSKDAAIYFDGALVKDCMSSCFDRNFGEDTEMGLAANYTIANYTLDSLIYLSFSIEKYLDYNLIECFLSIDITLTGAADENYSTEIMLFATTGNWTESNITAISAPPLETKILNWTHNIIRNPISLNITNFLKEMHSQNLSDINFVLSINDDKILGIIPSKENINGPGTYLLLVVEEPITENGTLERRILESSSGNDSTIIASVLVVLLGLIAISLALYFFLKRQKKRKENIRAPDTEKDEKLRTTLEKAGISEEYYLVLQKNHYTIDNIRSVNEHQLVEMRLPLGIRKKLLNLIKVPESYIFEEEFFLHGITIEEHLGTGSFGSVYKGKWNSTPVALKKLNHAQHREEFLAEAKLLVSLRHPHIISMFGVHSLSEEEKYIVMELMPLGNLRDFLLSEESKKLNLIDLIKFAEHIAKGMTYLSESGIVHRDLSCRNLLMKKENDDYIIKVGDFGLSRQVSQDEIYQANNQSLFPVKWTAPEGIKYGIFSKAGDVWSFGIVLWEIFSYGAIPFAGLSNEEVVALLDSGKRLPQPTKCPDRLYELMINCWAERPEDRPTFQIILSSLKLDHSNYIP